MPNMKSKIHIYLIILSVVLLGIFCFLSFNSAETSAELSNPDIVKTDSNSEIPKKETEDKTLSLEELAEIFKSAPYQLVTHVGLAKDIPSPKSLTFTPDGKEMWVASLMNAKSGLTVFDTDFLNDELDKKVNAELGTLSLTNKKSTTTAARIADIVLPGGGAVEVIFSKDGAFAYVSQMETGRVFEIDTATKNISRIFNTNASWTKIMILSNDGTKLYASNWTSNTVSEIDLVTGKLVRNIPTVTTPRGLYVTKDGTYLYVAGFDKGEIQKIDLSTGKGTVIYKTGGAMRHIVADEDAPNGGVLYISDMGKASIFKVSLSDDSVTKFASTDIHPNTIALSPDNKVLIVSCRGANKSDTDYYNPGPEWGSVLLFDTETGKMLDAIVGGNQPTALDSMSNGNFFAFSDFLDARIQIFSLPDYEILKIGNGGRSTVYKSELKK